MVPTEHKDLDDKYHNQNRHRDNEPHSSADPIMID